MTYDFGPTLDLVGIVSAAAVAALLLVRRVRKAPAPPALHFGLTDVEEVELIATGVGTFTFKDGSRKRCVTLSVQTRAGILRLAFDDDDADALAHSLSNTLDYYRFGIIGEGEVIGPDPDAPFTEPSS